MTNQSTENQTAGRIPVAAAREIATRYKLKQCLLIGWDGEMAHVVTFGKTKADCEAAAKAQDFWAGKIREFSFKGDAPSDGPQLTDEALTLLGDLIASMTAGDRDNLNCVANSVAFLKKHDHPGLFLPTLVRDMMER